MRIRKAEPADLESLLAIYNYEVEHGVATLDLHPRTLAQRREWLLCHNVDHHPLIVAETDGRVIGYASLSSYREKEAYASTVELSVYVDSACRGQGVATALMEHILDMARNDDALHLVVSVITAGNAASIRLHEKFGFVYCGSLHQVGRKFGRYLDIENYELRV